MAKIARCHQRDPLSLAVPYFILMISMRFRGLVTLHSVYYILH